MEEVLNQITPLEQLINSFILFIPKLSVAIIIFLVMLFLARLGQRLVRTGLEKRQVDAELVLLLSRATKISIIIFGTIWALAMVDFDVTGFVAGLGIVGFTLGFALQDIAENFVAGILLLIQQPFDIGDAVEAGGYSGIVTNIEIRTTTIRTWDGLLVLVPNAQVYRKAITNYSKVPQRRINIDVGVSYDSDLNHVEKVLLEAARQTPGVKDDPTSFVVFNKFADSAINATLYFWIDTSEAGYFDALDSVMKGIKVAFEQEGIEIPFPQQVIALRESLSEQISEVA